MVKHCQTLPDTRFWQTWPPFEAKAQINCRVLDTSTPGMKLFSSASAQEFLRGTGWTPAVKARQSFTNRLLPARGPAQTRPRHFSHELTPEAPPPPRAECSAAGARCPGEWFYDAKLFFFMVTNVARDRKFMPLWILRFLLHLKRSDTGWAISKEMWTLAVSEPTENSYLDTLGSNGEQKAMQGPWNWMITSNTANGYKTRTWKLKETNTQTNKPWAETAMNFYLARRHFQKAGQLLGPRSWKSLLAFTTFCSQESSVHVVFFWTSLLLLVTAEGEKASIINCHAIIQISSNQFPHCLETHNPQACEEESI